MENKKTTLKLVSAIITIMLMMWSCKDRVPNEYPNKKEMIGILTDLHICEATTNNSIASSYDAKSYYKAVLEKHNITKNLFDSAIAWYGAHPTIYAEIYDEVIANLSELEAQAMSDLSKFEELERLFADKQLWLGVNSITLPYADTINTQFPFDLKTDSLNNGELIVKANYKVNKEDKSTNSYKLIVVTTFSNNTNDTLSCEIDKKVLPFKAYLATKVIEGKSLIGVKGFLLQHNLSVKPKVEIDSISITFKPNKTIKKT